MPTEPSSAERLPGQNVPAHHRVFAALLMIVCSVWLNVRPQFTDLVYRPMNSLYVAGHKSEHGWPLVAVQIFRPQQVFYQHRLPRRVPFSVAIDSYSGVKLAYNACACFALVLLAAIFYLPWDAYPEPKFSLIEMFVFLTSAAVGVAFISSQFATQASFGETVSLAAIWIVGTGIVNGIFAHVAWRARRRRAMAQQGAATGNNAQAN